MIRTFAGMKKNTPLFIGAVFLISFFVAGCHSRKLASSPSTVNNHHPQFINDISLGEHSTSSVTVNNITAETSHKKGRRKRRKKENALLSKYAGMLGVPTKRLTNYNLYQFIDDWYGVSYRRGGCDKDGIDCSAFAQKLYEEVFGINLVRTSIEQFNSCRLKTDIDDLEEGDLVFFRINGKRISHVGVYLMNNYFVHASSNGVMISSLAESYWQRCFAGGGSVPKNNG